MVLKFVQAPEFPGKQAAKALLAEFLTWQIQGET